MLARTRVRPSPTVPRRRRAESVPDTVIGKSVDTRPLTVLSSSSAPKFDGNSSVIAPFTVSYSRSSARPSAPMDTSILPFTVLAYTGPPALRAVMLPFTVVARTSVVTSRTSTPPFTVARSTRVPSGTFTTNRTDTSLRSFHRVRRSERMPRSSQVAPSVCKAQITTLSPDFFCSMRTSSGLPRRQRFSPTTSTRPLVLRSTSTPPLTFLM